MWNNPLFRTHLSLWLALIIGVILLIAFGEPGLVACLLLYFTAFVFALRTTLQQYKIYRHSSGRIARAAARNLFFGMDAPAGASFLLGIVLRVAARPYGAFYGQLGIALLVTAGLIWELSIIWAVKSFFRTRDPLMLIMAFSLTWISLIGVYVLVFAPPPDMF